ncbi:MAG: helix-turn-helix transcriptional regulator [Terriglobia bacterium]|nr:helix-turn-helix transcriptional regulator [Terriglobia bacterium]
MKQTPAQQQLNGLWIARKRAGLEQKVVARLLEQKSTSQVSEYERGRLLPNLRTALKLAVIYKTPVCELYRELYDRAKDDVNRAGYRVQIPNTRPNPFYVYSQRAHFGD